MITPTFPPDVGGVETMLKNLCFHLAQHKFYVDVVTHSPLIVKKKALLKERFNEYVTVWRIPWVGFGLFNIFERYPFIQFLYIIPGLLLGSLLILFKTGRRLDVIHAFGLSGAFVGGLASRVFSIPCVVDMCTVYRLRERRILAPFVRVILNWCDYIRGNSPVGKKELVNIGINSVKLGIITPFVDETIFKPIPQIEARTKIGLPQHGYVVLFVGRMINGKGVDIAIDAVCLVKRSDVTFVFIGEGPLQRLVEKASVSDKRIHMVGNAKHHDLVYYYNAADVLICAPVDSELIAFVGREALMCGLPILAFNVAVYFGIPYTVESGLIPQRVGRLLEPKPEALAVLLEELIFLKATNGISPFDSQACRKYALDRYSSCTMEKLKDIYQKTICMHSLRILKSSTVFKG